MRYFLSILICSLAFVAGRPPQSGPRKLALIFAIGKYDSTTGWRSISSINDLNYMKPTLMSQGFAENDIEIIRDEQATKKGMTEAIDRLIARAQAGDIIVFHFSGHGQQVFDDNGDEADGYDEALVPYNANMRYGGGYTGQNHFRDDELGEKFKQLRRKIGKEGSLLVLLDACHSGTATRGQEIAIARGAEAKCEPPGYAQKITTSRGAQNEGVFDDKELLSNMVVISAASADQLNYETKDAGNNGVGALSYAFSRAISQTTGAINYKILFEKIKTDIQSWKPYQNPQIEGNTEQQVLGGKFIRSSDIIRISRWNPDNTIEVPRGLIHSVVKGARFKVFPVDVTDFKNTQPVAEGEITDAQMGKSTGTFKGTAPSRTGAYNIVFETRNFGDMSVAVKINLANAAAAGLIRDKLSQYEYISLDKTSADIAITAWTDPQSRQDMLQVVAANDSVLWQKPWSTQSNVTAAETEAIFEQIRQYSRAQFLRSISTPADAKVFEYVQVEFIPGVIKTVNGIDSLIPGKTLKDFMDARGDICFREANDEATMNEGFLIRVRNLQDYPVYISVLDIMPDNAIAVVMPDPGDVNSTAEDYKIAARQTFTSRPIKLYPPYGKDFMKILITKTAMDLKSVQSRTVSRGAGSSFESFYNDTFKDDQSERSRGPKVSPVKVDEIRIIPFTYNILPQKK